MTIDNVKVSRSRMASREDRRFAASMATRYRRRRDNLVLRELYRNGW